MLPQLWRGKQSPYAVIAELDRLPKVRFELTGSTILNLNKDVSGLKVRVGNDVLQVVEGPPRHVGLVEKAADFIPGVTLQGGGDFRAQLINALDSLLVFDVGNLYEDENSAKLLPKMNFF